jgi:hypothetical protein
LHAWKNRFLRRAKDLRLWAYIDPEGTASWPSEPLEPDLTDFPRRQNNGITTRTAARAAASGSSRGTAEAGSYGTEEFDEPPASTLDLSDAGRNAYNDVINVFKEHKADR